MNDGPASFSVFLEQLVDRGPRGLYVGDLFLSVIPEISFLRVER